MSAPKPNNYSQNQAPQPEAPRESAPTPPPDRPTAVPLGLPGVGRPVPSPASGHSGRHSGAEPQWIQAASSYLTVRLVHTLAFFAVPLLLGTALDIFALATGGPLELRLAGAALILVALLWGGWWLLTTPRRTRALAYALEANHLMTRRGLIFRGITSIPYGRIQYVDVDSGPLERACGVSRLTVRTAGASSGTVVLYGIPTGTVDGVRAELVHRADERMAAL